MRTSWIHRHIGGALARISLFCCLLPGVAKAADFSAYVKTSGVPKSGDCFYGSYQGATPGAGAFSTLMRKAETEHRLLMVIYCQSSCSHCDAFEQDWVADARSAPLYVAYTLNGYFRGSDTASLAAKTEVKKWGAAGDCHLVGFYGQAQDGQIFKDRMTLPTSVKSLKATYDGIRNRWNSFELAHRYTPPGVVFETGTTVGTQLQAVEDADSVRVPLLRVSNTGKVETTEMRVTYPDNSVTTNTLDWVANETNKIVHIAVLGPWQVGQAIKLALFDTTTKKQIGDAATIAIVAGGNSFAFPDIDFDDEGRWGQWTLDSAANWEKALAKTVAANTYFQPDTNDTPTVENIVVDFPVSPSNRYEVVYTNDITFFADSKETVDAMHRFEFTVTNLVTTVHTNDLAAFSPSGRADETVAFEAVFPGGLMIVTNYVESVVEGAQPEYNPESAATYSVTVTNRVYGVEDAQGENPAEWTWARTVEEKPVECFTNLVVRAEADGDHAIGTSTTNFAPLVCSAQGTKRYFLNKTVAHENVRMPVAENFASNCVYAVSPQEGAPFSTNLYSCIQAAFEGEVVVDNEITVLPCEGEAAPTSETVAKADDQKPVVGVFDVPDTATYYTVLSNWQETVEQEHVGYGTNRMFYVELPGCVTNEDVAAQMPVGKTMAFATTNFYQVALTNAENAATSYEVTWTNFEATIAVDCTNFYYTVETNEYQYGAAGREAGGRDEKRIQSFVLKVTGSAVWHADTVAFATNVLDSAEFAEWCAANNVLTVLHECADPATGASLFSYTTAANGRSGTAFLSRNGLVASECEQPAASNVFEVALYRPDGSLVAILAPQCNGGKFDREENISRLDELLDVAEDLTEPDNNDAASTPLKAYYGRTIMTEPPAEIYTLNISDKKDVFELVEVPSGEYVSIWVQSYPPSRYNGQEKPKVRMWRRTSGDEIEPVGADQEGAPVWAFSDEDVNAGIYADVTAWTNDYAATGRFCVNDTSWFGYALMVAEAGEFPGKVSFVNPSEEDYDIDSETEIALKVNRTGYTGTVTATVELVSSELPLGCFSWACDANSKTNLVWGDRESGAKIIPVTVRNVTWEDSSSNLVFAISSVLSDSGATLDEAKSTCKIGIQQEDDQNALTGRIRISSPEVAIGETLWKKEGEQVDVTVTRERILNEATGKKEARGEATATITALGGAILSADSVEWRKGMRTGDRDFSVTMPEVGKAGEQQVVLTVAGTDCDGNIISDAAKSRIKFMVVPKDAPEFVNGIDLEAYQHVAFDEYAMLEYNPQKMDVVGFDVLSGALPAGLSAAADEFGLHVFGAPVGTNSANVVYQLKLQRKSDGYYVKTMPVTVKIMAKALGGSASGGVSDAVIPAFSERRVWQYLPMTNEEGRLVGFLNLSASVKGSVSARYTTSGSTVMFSKAALDSVFADADGGGYRALASMEKAGYSLDVSFTTDGRVFATLEAPDESRAGFATEVGAKPWASNSGGAFAWKGRYAVAFPQTGVEVGAMARGTTAIALNMASPAMAKVGRITFNGVLPNGKPMNGTTALVPAVEGANEVKVPILWSSASDAFSAMLVAKKAGADVYVSLDSDVKPYWSGEGGGDISASGERFVALGWAEEWSGAKPLVFKYDGRGGGSSVALSGTRLEIATKGSVQEDGFSLETIVLNRTSGMVSGTLKTALDGQIATISFKGAVLPRSGGVLMAGCAWYVSSDGRIAVPVEISIGE